jgi:hypothetical protein
MQRKLTTTNTDSPLVRRLAELLASYEMDAPHADEPEGTANYPNITWDQLVTWMGVEHHGDCVNLPCSCTRCFAEAIVHQARWMAERLTDPTLLWEAARGTDGVRQAVVVVYGPNDMGMKGIGEDRKP